MGDVMIRCPKTNRPINTGISMDRESFESSRFKNRTVACPHCGESHRWDKKDASIADE